MTAPDLILAIGPSVVALAAIGTAFLQHDRTLKHERQLRDLDALRDAAATAAMHLAEAVASVARVAILLDEMEPIPHAERALLEQINARIEFVTERLTLLLGVDHPMVRLCSDAGDTVWEVFRIPDDGPTAFQMAIGETLFRQADHCLGELMDARKAFASIATRTVGASLPPLGK